ncbi:hypothetical protein F9B74_09140 [Pelistega sp. NLN82]|uniref:Uncharacterized protein n=1 Tax=Pelistega ratti TaxID=2652177 RepID=A0A6L9Y7I2_9BURK|nr:hypothetical protein [Pelistega ratti]NEN76472.1 hypothetical protein [Pelistega ratti]
MGIGVLAGATIGGNKAAIQQGALDSFNVEKYNRQLHPDEVKWIQENAKHFAKEESERLGYPVTEQEAIQRLLVQAAQEIDFIWSKKIGSTDYRAQSFLKSATAYSEIPTLYSDNRGTFINANGKHQVMFTADKNEYVSTGKYAKELAKFDKANNAIITKTLQPEVKNNLYVKSLQDGVNTVINTVNYMGNHPDKVAKSIVFNTMNCLTEDLCISTVGNTLKESVGSVWQSGKDIGGIHYNLKDVSYLYGKDMRAEIDTIAAVRGGTALLELIGVGKTVGTGVKVVGTSADLGINLAKESAKNMASKAIVQADDTYSRLKDLSKGEVTVYRVEGIPNQRLIIDDKGNVNITGNTTLYLNFGSKKRAVEYLQQKRDKELPGAEIKRFAVLREFRKDIADIAISEKDIKSKDPTKVKPVIADPTKANYQYGLRKDQIELLKSKIIEGSGKNGNK